MSEVVLRSAQILVGQDVHLSELPDGKQKKEFLELAELAINEKINSLQKVRLEYLTNQMRVLYENYVKREEKEKAIEKAAENQKRHEHEKKLLQKHTKKGQPVLRNLAKVQLEQIERQIAKEKDEGREK